MVTSQRAGHTLLELLVGLAISSILMLALSLQLLTSQRLWLQQVIWHQEQEVLRFSVPFLRSRIRQAQAVDASSQAQRLVLNHSALHARRNCLGQLQSSGSQFQEVFELRQQQLYCNNQPLIAGISALAFSYGVDLNADGQLSDAEWLPDAPCCLPVLAVSIEWVDRAEQPQRFIASLRRSQF